MRQTGVFSTFNTIENKKKIMIAFIFNEAI